MEDQKQVKPSIQGFLVMALFVTVGAGVRGQVPTCPYMGNGYNFCTAKEGMSKNN